MTFGLYDGIVIAILALSGLIAFYRGFMREALGLGAWIAAGFAGIYGYPLLSSVFDKVFKSHTAANITAGVLISLAVLIVCFIAVGLITKKVRGSMLGGLDRTLGFLFGLLRGSIVVMLAYILALVLIPVQIYHAEQDNFGLAYVKKGIEACETLLPENMATELDLKLKDASALAAKQAKETAAREAKAKAEADGYENTDRESLDLLIGGLSEPEENAEVKAETKAESKTEAKPESKAESKSKAKPKQQEKPAAKEPLQEKSKDISPATNEVK